MTRLENTINELHLAATTEGRLACRASRKDGLLELAFAGNGELPDLTSLKLLLQRAHAFATRAQVPKVVVDFTDLKFMNSSCFKAFVTWLTQIGAGPDPLAMYKIHFRLNPAKRWQRVSVSALACFAVDSVTFE